MSDTPVATVFCCRRFGAMRYSNYIQVPKDLSWLDGLACSLPVPDQRSVQ